MIEMQSVSESANYRETLEIDFFNYIVTADYNIFTSAY